MFYVHVYVQYEGNYFQFFSSYSAAEEAVEYAERCLGVEVVSVGFC